jgi:carbamoylphosphate synthase large subunit
MKILITSIGSLGLGPSLVKNLRKSIKGIEIYGTDITEESAAMHLVDHSIIVPLYGKEEITMLYNICKDEKIDLIISLNADQELLPLTEWNEKEKIFDKINTKIVGMPSAVLKKCVFKNLTYDWLKNNNLNYAQYFTPKNIEEFKRAIFSLGYPKKKVVVKPIVGAGNRGFRILDSKYNLLKSITEEKPDSSTTNLVEYARILEKSYKFPEIVVMEYLEGKEYTVYCLANQGNPIYIIPLTRIKTTAGMSLIAQVDLNEQVIDYAKKIIKAFKLHSNCDLQIKFNENNLPALYEINPRYSASIILPYAAGVDLAYFGVLQALGNDVPKIKVKDRIKMIRYCEEIFINNGKLFRVS